MSQLHQVALTFIKSIGPGLGRTLLSCFGSAEAVFNASPAKLVRVPGISQKRLNAMDFDAALKRAEQELKYM